MLYLGLFFLSGGFLYFCIAIQKKFYSLQEKIKNQQFILDHTPLPWCALHLQSNNFFYSSSFEYMFNLQSPLEIDDLFRIFSATPLTTFYKAVHNLMTVGGIFTLHDSFKNKEILITGHKIFRENSDYIYITFDDITKKHDQHKKMEQTNKHLKSENKVLNDLLNKIPFAVWHRDRHGRINYCNEIYANLLDCSREKTIAENLDLLPKNQIDLHHMSQDALKEQKTITIRTRAIMEGNRRLLEIGCIPLKDSTLNYAFDVTEIQTLETQLTSTIKAYREIFNTVSVPIAVFDTHKNLSYYNKAYAHFFEFDEKLLENRPAFSDVLDDLRRRKKIPEHANFPHYKAKRHELFQSLIAPIDEFSDLPDGRSIRLRIAPYPFGGLIFVFENITNQLDLERGVNTLLAVQKETLNHLYEGLIVIGSNGKINLINPAIQKIFGHTEDLLSQHMNIWMKTIQHSFITNDEFLEWQQKITHLIVNRHSAFDQLHLKDDLVLRWFYIPLPDGSNMLGFLNISEDWKLEQKLNNKNQSLVDLDKLKQAYIKDITHQLQSPLDHVISISRNLQEQLFGDLNELQLSYCHLLYDHTSMLKFLIDDMLCLIGAEQIQTNPEPILVSPLLNSITSLLTPILNDQGVDLLVDYLKDDIQIHADKRRFKQASLSVIKDLLKNIPQGSEIRLKPEFNSDCFALHIISPKMKKKTNTLGALIAQKIMKSHQGNFTQTNERDYHLTCLEIPINRP